MAQPSFDYPEPQFALVESFNPRTGEPGLLVEAFDPAAHIHPRWGWARAGVTLFGNPDEVSHLRPYIIN